MKSELYDAIRYYLASSYYSMKNWVNSPYQVWFFVLQNLISLSFLILSISVIYSVSSGITGWSYFQLLFLSVLSQLTMGISSFVVIPQMLPEMLREGQFDTYLVRPYGKLTLMASSMGIVSYFFSYFIGGIAVLAYISVRLKLQPAALLGLLPLYVLGVAAFTMFMAVLAVAMYAFFKSGAATQQIERVLWTLGAYPLNVYGAAAQLFFTLLVPIGIATYYPSQAFFGRVSLLHYAFLSIFAVFFISLMYMLFNRLMRSYESGGG
jgi:ABC-2 type transport system permease protein